MKRKTATFMALVAGLVFASGAFAGEGKHMDMHHGTTSGGMTSGQTSGHMTGTTSDMHVTTSGTMNLHSADQFIGTPVRDNTGAEVGTVKDLMVSFEGERVSYAVVEGKDGSSYLVPLSAFSSTHTGNFVTLNADRSTLAAAPQPQSGMTEQEYGRRLHEHFGLGYVWRDLPGDVPVRQDEVPGSNLTYPGNRPVIPSEEPGRTGTGRTGSDVGTQTR
jgi:sporulation protein YlmC with PRC-barrel domain